MWKYLTVYRKAFLFALLKKKKSIYYPLGFTFSMLACETEEKLGCFCFCTLLNDES